MKGPRSGTECVLSPHEAAGRLGISERTLQRMKLPRVRRGNGLTGYLESVVDAAMRRFLR